MAIQKYHQDVKKNKDVAYNFLIGEDGNVYEGRGYTTRGGHMPDSIYFYNEKGQNDIFNLNSYGIAFIGNFNERAPNQTAIDAFHNLVDVRNLHFYYLFFVCSIG